MIAFDYHEQPPLAHLNLSAYSLFFCWFFYRFQVTRTDFKDGGKRGVFYGKLPGDPNSFVTVAFINGREAFTVISPQNQIHLVGEAREPGEIVVKNINPATYGRPGN